ncbi:ATP-dependent RNA helicase HAS1, putative [Plasmodium ovale wallikeri]|uniref:ATP-dependent RNA helicase n=2 Tax=Plasmodium ovale TaxID=36330 RepID=A0A1C3KU18_PLAOA|nr:ATP-dependent RNA helicase HAS1, putative [Plasmodium ovale wallikeri]SBT77616.1 ATP-dependent RNA helicase HAS1, putative [Plasmodium ovale]
MNNMEEEKKEEDEPSCRNRRDSDDSQRKHKDCYLGVTKDTNGEKDPQIKGNQTGDKKKKQKKKKKRKVGEKGDETKGAEKNSVKLKKRKHGNVMRGKDGSANEEEKRTCYNSDRERDRDRVSDRDSHSDSSTSDERPKGAAKMGLVKEEANGKKHEESELTDPHEAQNELGRNATDVGSRLTNRENQSSGAATSQEGSAKENFYSEKKFEDLTICEALKKGLKELNFVTLTEIQAKCIPHFLSGKDILGAAKTGSGKTLAFLVPSINILYNIKFLPKNGTGVLIISPTRELCLQIYQVCKDLCKYIPQTNGIIIGGMSRNEEKKKFIHGINILIATPGRLLDHMQNTKEFIYKNLICLIIDEADRLLQIGFEEEINLIVKRLPKKRQTALFSATQTTKVESLIRLSLHKPIFIEVTTKIATVERLQQGYAIVDEDKRFLLLFTFLKRNASKKIMVFFNNCMSVQFYNDLLNYIDIPTFCIHGKKKQNKRLKSFSEFSSAQSAILLCTNVAARGLDIPNVNYIIQYDPPDDSKEYIHRVGRTCRGNDSSGSAIIFLMKHELKFLNYLKFYNIPINQFAYDSSKLINIQSHIQSIVTKNFHLHKMAREAFKSYLNGYITYALKDVFDVNNLDLLLTSKNFGLDVPPKVDLNLKLNVKKRKFK